MPDWNIPIKQHSCSLCIDFNHDNPCICVNMFRIICILLAYIADEQLNDNQDLLKIIFCLFLLYIFHIDFGNTMIHVYNNK